MLLSDSIAVISAAQADSIKVINANQVADFYATLLDKQSNQFTILISALCGIVVVIILATCWWNYLGAKKQISDEMEKQKNAMSELINKSLKDINQKASDSIKEQIDALSKSLREELGKFKTDISKTNKNDRASISRIYALNCEESGHLFTAATWWYAAASLYNKSEDQEFTQISVDAGLAILKEYLKIYGSDKDKGELKDEEDFQRMEKILKNVDSLPDYFASQKRDTKSLVKSLKKMVTSDSPTQNKD